MLPTLSAALPEAPDRGVAVKAAEAVPYGLVQRGRRRIPLTTAPISNGRTPDRTFTLFGLMQTVHCSEPSGRAICCKT